MLIAGQLSFLRVKVMCDDLVSFTFIFHFFSQFSTVWSCSWRLREAVVGSAWVANIAVSSANVPTRCVPGCKHHTCTSALYVIYIIRIFSSLKDNKLNNVSEIYLVYYISTEAGPCLLRGSAAPRLLGLRV